MKVYLFKITNKLTGQTEIGITRKFNNIWTELIERKTSMGEFLLTQEDDSNISVEILEEAKNLWSMYKKAIEGEKVISHGNKTIEIGTLVSLMRKFGFAVDGKERITIADIHAFCVYLSEHEKISTNRNIIKKIFQDNGRLEQKRVSGYTFFILS